MTSDDGGAERSCADLDGGGCDDVAVGGRPSDQGPDGVVAKCLGCDLDLDIPPIPTLLCRVWRMGHCAQRSVTE